jgi:hypothetical protein
VRVSVPLTIFRVPSTTTDLRFRPATRSAKSGLLARSSSHVTPSPVSVVLDGRSIRCAAVRPHPGRCPDQDSRVHP